MANVKNIDFVNTSVTELTQTILVEIEGVFSEKFTNVIVRSIKSALEQEQQKWADEVKQRLSDVIPKQMLHKKRYPRSRKFPYLNSGELRNSVKTEVTQIDTMRKHSVVLDVWFKFLSKHALYTNEAWNSKDTPGWKGWATRTLVTGGSGIISAKQLLHNFFNSSKLQRLIRTV